MAKQSDKRSGRARAVALKYDAEGESAPRVTAKGSGALARKILEQARAGDVPVRSDPDLLELLASIDVMEEVPPDLYEVVAEVLAFVYDVNEQKKSELDGSQMPDVANSDSEEAERDSGETDSTREQSE